MSLNKSLVLLLLLVAASSLVVARRGAESSGSRLSEGGVAESSGEFSGSDDSHLDDEDEAGYSGDSASGGFSAPRGDKEIMVGPSGPDDGGDYEEPVDGDHQQHDDADPAKRPPSNVEDASVNSSSVGAVGAAISKYASISSHPGILIGIAGGAIVLLLGITLLIIFIVRRCSNTHKPLPQDDVKQNSSQ